MAFSATNWRDLLSNYSGSQAGTRSWSVLGQSQYQGKYYMQVFNYPNWKVRIRGCGGGTGKNVESFYKIVGSVSVFSTNFNGYYGYFTYFTYANGTVYSTPANISTFATFLYAPNQYFTGYSIGSSTQYSAGPVVSINDTTYVAFYNYSPWGSGPYTAGSNIAIGKGDVGPAPYSGYPYQRYYNAYSLC